MVGVSREFDCHAMLKRSDSWQFLVSHVGCVGDVAYLGTPVLVGLLGAHSHSCLSSRAIELTSFPDPNIVSSHTIDYIAQLLGVTSRLFGYYSGSVRRSIPWTTRD